MNGFKVLIKNKNGSDNNFRFSVFASQSVFDCVELKNHLLWKSVYIQKNHYRQIKDLGVHNLE